MHFVPTMVPENMPWDEAQRVLEQQGVTDGLPVVPPTRSRVQAMLDSVSGELSLGKLPPLFNEATAEAVAVQCVMAGCRPEYFPIVWTALAAMMSPPFNLLGIQTTTGNAAPVIIVNGPVRKTLDINSGCNCLSVSVKSNATIGRAVRLSLLNIGGAQSGVLDMATMGQPAKLSFCFAENEEESPWEPLHVSRGFQRGQSTVTVASSSGLYELVDSNSRSAEETLQWIGCSLTPLANLGVQALTEGSSGLLILAPETAHLLARDGYSRRDVQQRLYELAQVPLNNLPPSIRATLTSTGRLQADRIHLLKSPDHLIVVTAGGVGIKSTFVPGWGGGSEVITKPIQAGRSLGSGLG